MHARAILEANGIPSMVSDGRTFRDADNFAYGARLSVRREDVDAALELIPSALHSLRPERDASH